jgi:hypothetical protein
MLACRGLVLAGAGIWLGALASTVTSETLKPLGPRPIESAAADDAAGSEPIGPAIAWARQAYAFGLRDCPRVTDTYYAACMQQMREEARLAAEWQRQQAQWAAAEPQPAYYPEPEPVQPPAIEQVSYEPAPAASAPQAYAEEPAAPAPDDVDGLVEPPPEVSSPPAG